MMPAKLEPTAEGGASITDNCLLDGRVRLYQPARGYRIAIDPVLLAAAIPVKPGEHVVDLGAGVGGATFCLLARQSQCRVTAVEVQSVLADLAHQNALRNGFAEQMKIIERSFQDLGPDLVGSADHVMANPPYLPLDRAAPSRRADRATVEGEAELADWVHAALSLVRPKGSVTFIQRADRLDALLEALRKSAGEIIVCPLWPKAGVSAKRILVRGRKGVASPLTLSSGLTLHADDGQYTPAAENILRHAAPLDLRSVSS